MKKGENFVILLFKKKLHINETHYKRWMGKNMTNLTCIYFFLNREQKSISFCYILKENPNYDIFLEILDTSTFDTKFEIVLKGVFQTLLTYLVRQI